MCAQRLPAAMLPFRGCTETFAALLYASSVCPLLVGALSPHVTGPVSKYTVRMHIKLFSPTRSIFQLFHGHIFVSHIHWRSCLVGTDVGDLT